MHKYIIKNVKKYKGFKNEVEITNLYKMEKIYSGFLFKLQKNLKIEAQVTLSSFLKRLLLFICCLFYIPNIQMYG